ncbi:MAG TPA: GNAT family N-acetyltransferase [Gemmatimonadaceae bacterium]|nr:GNAT family N-acetyltransferase [Gemmatimonadaceae bacterium]
MAVEVRPASAGDVPTLVALMREFYAEAGFSLPEEAAAGAFGALLADPRLGDVWLALDGGAAAGYLVLTLSFSMEYGGLRGFIDDLYVRPASRRRGAGAGLLAAARAEAARKGVRALHVEVGPESQDARRLYARAGYVESGHLLLTRPLATPVHAT